MAHQVGRSLKISKSFPNISIIFVGLQRMQSINKKYLGHDYVTDVITFDLGGSGEIIICPQEAKRNAKTYGSSVEREILLYVIHGFLHLAGYDDHNYKDIIQMRLKEKEFLEEIK